MPPLRLPRPQSWRDVAASQGPARGVQFTRGGLGRQRTNSEAMQRAIARIVSSGGGSAGDGMTEDLRGVLEQAEGSDGGDGFQLGDIWGGAKKAFTTALDVVDTPRAAIVAGLSEFEEALGNVPETDESYWDKVTRHMSAAELSGTQGMAELRGQDSGGLAQGLALDVGLDPLTYVAPEAKLDDVQRVARQLSAAGRADDAARVLRARTPSVLSDEAIEAIGARGGIYVNTPGKGPVGRTLQVDNLIDNVASRLTRGRVTEVPRQIQIASRQSAVGRAGVAASRALHAPIAGVLNSRPVTGLTRVGLNGSKPLLRTMLRSGDPELATNALWGMTADAQGRYASHGWEQVAGERAAAILSRARDAKIDTSDITRAVRGDADAVAKIDAIDPDLVADVQANTQLMRQELNDLTDLADDEGVRMADLQRDEAARRGVDVSELGPRSSDWVADAGDFYQPRYLDEDKELAQQVFQNGGRQGSTNRVVNIMGRKYYPGEEFMGRVLVDPADAGKSIERQMDEILYADGVIDQRTLNQGSALFKDDLAETLPLYIRMMGTQASREVTASRLKQLGIGEDMFKLVTDAKGEYDAGYLHELTNRLSAQKARQRQAQRWADDADEALTGVRDDAIDFGDDAAARAADRELAAAEPLAARSAIGADAEVLEEYAAASFAAADDLQRSTYQWLEGDVSAATTAMRSDVAAQQAVAATARAQLDEGMARLDRLYEYRQELVDEMDGALQRAAQRTDGGEGIARAMEETSDELSRADALLNEMEGGLGDLQGELAKTDELLGQVKTKLDEYKRQLNDANSVLAYTTLLRGSAATDDFASGTATAWDRQYGARARPNKRWLQRQINIGEDVAMGLGRRRSGLQRAVERSNGEVIGARSARAAAKEADDAELLRMFDWGRDSLARQYQELGDAAGPELREAIMRPVIEAEEALSTAEREIANMGPSLVDLQSHADLNTQRLDDLKAQLAEHQVSTATETTSRVAQAFGLRNEADGLFQAAAEAQARHTELMAQQAPTDVAAFQEGMADAVAGAMADEATLAQYDGIIAHLEGQAKAAEATLAEANQAVGLTEKWIRDLGDVQTAENVESMLRQGYRQFGATTMLPQDLAEAMSAAARINTPDGLKAIVGAFDRVQGLWKAYQVASPGFHFRNTFGGVTNNWVAGMDEVAYQRYVSLSSGPQRTRNAFRSRHPEWAEAFDAFVAGGFHTGGQTSFEVESNVFSKSNLRPWSRDFGPLRANRTGVHVGNRMVAPGGEQVENFLRGSLYMDTYVKGRKGGMAAQAAADEAMHRMLKFHFDYEDLSRVERSVMRRVMPFYTWTRKNLPLQLEMLAKQPQKINRYFVVKRNVETMSEEEGVVPPYFQDSFAMRLPFTEGGGNVYAMPDLPFQSISEIADPGMTAGMVTPIIKTPYELWAGKQVFKGLPLSDDLKPAPPSFVIVPGLMQGLSALGWAERGADGMWYSSAKGNYLIEQSLPLMARARRLAPGAAAGQPTDQRYEDRFWSSMLSFNMGLGVRTNTSDEQENVLWGRYFDIKADLERAQQLGFVDPGRIGSADVMAAAA